MDSEYVSLQIRFSILLVEYSSVNRSHQDFSTSCRVGIDILDDRWRHNHRVVSEFFHPYFRFCGWLKGNIFLEIPWEIKFNLEIFILILNRYRYTIDLYLASRWAELPSYTKYRLLYLILSYEIIIYTLIFFWFCKQYICK